MPDELGRKWEEQGGVRAGEGSPSGSVPQQGSEGRSKGLFDSVLPAELITIFF